MKGLTTLSERSSRLSLVSDLKSLLEKGLPALSWYLCAGRLPEVDSKDALSG